MVKLVSAVIVNWNGGKFLVKCLNSLLKQDYLNLEIIVVDNASTDKSIEIIKENFGDKVKIFENMNTGYAGGSNKGLEIANGEYILIANPDIVFEKTYISKCICKLSTDSNICSVGGKLLKYDFDRGKKLNIIDSVGIRLNHKRQGYDIGQNQVDKGEYDFDRRVFGICGAAILFDKAILDKISINGEFFDENFFAYKEDIDLAWRINLCGYRNFYIHNAVAYHGRGMNSAKGIINIIKNRKKQSKILKGMSFRNHYFMLMKNETKKSFGKDIFFITFLFFRYILFFIMFDFRCLKYVEEIWKGRKQMLKKRKFIMRKRKLSESEIYKLFEL